MKIRITPSAGPIYILFLLIFFMSLYLPCFANTSQNGMPPSADTTSSLMIRLGPTHFDPLTEVNVFNDQHLAPASEDQERIGYYIVQFDGPIQEDWKNALAQTGAEILDYVPDFAFSVRMRSGLATVVRALNHVRWVGPYRETYRLSSSALEKMYVKGGQAEQQMVSLRVVLFAGAHIGINQAAIQALGGSIESISESGQKITLQVIIPASAIGELSALEDVKWVEKAPQWHLHNSVSTDIIDARMVRDTYGLYGQGQVVAVSDTGLDTGVVATLHSDFSDDAGGSRVNQIIDRTGTGASDVYSGHGTHVAGSVLGNGLASGSDPSADDFPDTSYAGLAPKASLIFQALEDNTDAGNLAGIPVDLNDLFSQAQTAGAHLQSNSWGEPTASFYTSGAQDVDQYMWDHKDYLILYSAGSIGVDMDADGVIDSYRIESPGTAKNCLTVGASEGYQPSGVGRDSSWGAYPDWVSWFSADPIASDHVSNNEDGMAAISSLGPTLDGRTKPDLVAPGSNILSTRSSVASGTGWGALDAYYMWSGGTSTSTPLTAGAAAVIRQYLIEAEGFTTPSAALLKAALINSAEDISPGQYGEIPSVPNSVAGWGRLNVGNAIYPLAPLNVLYYDDTVGLATGVSQDYTIRVTDTGAPLKINLVWTDYPGDPANQGGLVNDLDLHVTDPSATVHYPDQAVQKATLTTISYDSDSFANRNVAEPQAMRFTPAGSATYLDSIYFAFYNDGASGGAVGNVDVMVYGDDGAGRPDTGTVLFSKTLTFVPWTDVTIPVNIDVGTSDFHVAIIDSDTTNLGLYADNANPPDDRSSYYNGASWVDSVITPYIRVNMREANASSNYDRVNNAVGVTIDTPAIGDYIVHINGFSVPQGGAQPYALIASGNVVDPQAGTIQLNAATYSVGEAAGTATITVTRTGGSDGAVSVAYATSNGTASAGSDYTASSGTLSWADGDAADKIFNITIADDATFESDETINLTLSNVVGNAVMGTQETAVLTIIDDDAVPGTLQFSAATYSVDEGAGTATITVTRTGGSDGAISVDCATSNGTATAGSDYTANTGTLNWADGDSASKTFSVVINDDSTDESDETVNLALSNPTGGAGLGVQNSAELTIVDNDAAPSPPGSGGGSGGGCFIQQSMQ